MLSASVTSTSFAFSSSSIFMISAIRVSVSSFAFTVWMFSTNFRASVRVSDTSSNCSFIRPSLAENISSSAFSFSILSSEIIDRSLSSSFISSISFSDRKSFLSSALVLRNSSRIPSISPKLPSLRASMAERIIAVSPGNSRDVSFLNDSSSSLISIIFFL